MSTTDLARPRFARMYVKAAKSAEQRGATEHRRRLLEGLSGTVVELGAGHGLNFPHYPTAVTEVLAIEPEPTLRAHAAEAAASSPIPIRVLGGVADELPLEDESVDAAVASLVLCSVPDQDRALAELRRVLRAGGECASTSTSSPTVNPSDCSSKPPTAAACGRGSPVAAIPRVTRKPRSSAPASSSRAANG